MARSSGPSSSVCFSCSSVNFRPPISLEEASTVITPAQLDAIISGCAQAEPKKESDLEKDYFSSAAEIIGAGALDASHRFGCRSSAVVFRVLVLR